MPTSPDDQPDVPTGEVPADADADSGATVADSGDADATTAQVTTMSPEQRAELLADNRKTREELRARETAKDATDDESDGESGDEQPAAGPVDPARVPGRVPNRPAGRPKKLVGVLVALVVALAVACGVLGYLYATADQGGEGIDSAAAKSALADAKKYAAEVVTYSPGNYSDLDRRIREISTKEFADRYVESSQDARRGNDEAKASSVGTAVNAGLTSLTSDQAVVLVALDQKVTSPEVQSGKDGIPYQTRVLLTLKRDGDRWLIADLETI
ncbi:hypothetical protein [Gordonia sp. FQ]|uniref:hypothetical protein n=1 Tax=Gordonia sp. FQ TaxID=3446634 RepID=UPI003F855D9F